MSFDVERRTYIKNCLEKPLMVPNSYRKVHIYKGTHILQTVKILKDFPQTQFFCGLSIGLLAVQDNTALFTMFYVT